MSFDVVLLNDFHYGFPSDREEESYIEPVLKDMVSEINRNKPDLVVGMGDFIQHLDQETDTERLENVSEILSDIEPELYAIPGNNDLDAIGGYLGEEQLEWIEKEIEPEKTMYFFSHHILHDRDLSTNWYFHDKPELAICQDKKKFNDLIDGSNVEGVFSAHIHEEGLTKFRGTPHVTMNAMDKFNPPEEFQKYMSEVSLSAEGFSYSSEFQEHHV